MKKMKSLRRPATAAVSAAVVAVPFVAEAQQQPAGQTVNQGLVPNSWLFDASGNLVWLSEEDLKQYELAQLVTAEGAVQVDEAGDQVLGISTTLLNQIGWYSVGAGAAAGAAAALGSGFVGGSESSSTTSSSSTVTTPSSSGNLPGSVTTVDGSWGEGDRDLKFIFEDPDGIERASLIDLLEGSFLSPVGNHPTETPNPSPYLTRQVTTIVESADLIPGTTSTYSKITAELSYVSGKPAQPPFFYKDADNFLDVVLLEYSPSTAPSPTLTVIDDDIVENSFNQSVTYRYSNPDGIDRSYFTALLEWYTTVASHSLAGLFSSPPTITTTVDPSDLFAGSTDVYSSIEFTLAGPTGSLYGYGTVLEPLLIWDAMGSQNYVSLSLDIVPFP